MFRNILVAVDGSPAAARALEEAADIARSDGSRLVLINVVVPVRSRYSGLVLIPFPSDQDLERAAWDLLRRAEALVPPDVPVSSVVRMGSAAGAIVAQAEQGGHDLVVVGSRGLGRIGSLLLRSVSRAVIARSPAPVLVARAGRQECGRTAERAPGAMQAGRPAAGVSVEAESATQGVATVLLWLVAALLLELELIVSVFERTYGR